MLNKKSRLPDFFYQRLYLVLNLRIVIEYGGNVYSKSVLSPEISVVIGATLGDVAALCLLS